MKSVIAAFVALVVAAPIAALATSQGPSVNPEAQILADFTARVAAYLEMRKKADDSAPNLRETADADKIRAAQLGLAGRIRTARPSAKQGEIFTPAISTHLKRLLRPEASNKDTRETIQDDNPGAVPFKVNGPYPDKQPLSTMPVNILQALPRLPEKQDLDYRFIGKNLILLDSRADMIVDYLPNAIP